MAFRAGFAFTSMTIGPQPAAAILAAYVSSTLALEAVVADPGAVGTTIGRANAAKLGKAENVAAWNRNVTPMGILEDTPNGLTFDSACPSLVSHIVQDTFRVTCDRRNLRSGAAAVLVALKAPAAPASAALIAIEDRLVSRTPWDNSPPDWAATVDYEHLADIREQPATCAALGWIISSSRYLPTPPRRPVRR